jgi:hypothetical protein
VAEGAVKLVKQNARLRIQTYRGFARIDADQRKTNPNSAAAEDLSPQIDPDER